MKLPLAVRRFCARHRFRRRRPSAPDVNPLPADFIRRLNAMEPTPKPKPTSTRSISAGCHLGSGGL